MRSLESTRVGQRTVRRALASVLFALVLIGELAGSPAPARADSSDASTKQIPTNNATFGIEPSGPNGPNGLGYFSLSATPGATATEYVAIRNYSLHPLTLTLGESDAVNTPTGSFALLPSSQPSKDVGSWLKIPASMRKVSVRPRGTVVVPFRVEIPSNATPGDHAGGLTATLASEAVSKTGQRFHLLQTVGARFFVRVSGPLHPDLAVQNIQAHYQGSLRPVRGTTQVTYTVTNTGNVALGGRQVIRISGLLGLSASAQAPDLQLLLPGSSVTESIDVGGVVPQLWMNATVSVSPLVLPGTPPQQLPSAFTGSTHFWAIPWWLVILILIVVLALMWRRRRRRRGPKDETPKGKRGADEGRKSTVPASPPPAVPSEPVVVATAAASVAREPVVVPSAEPVVIPSLEPVVVPTAEPVIVVNEPVAVASEAVPGALGAAAYGLGSGDYSAPSQSGAMGYEAGIEPRCPTCGALVSAEAEWCSQCYTSLRSPNGQEPGLPEGGVR